jgi:hypothetical protein
LNSSIVIGAILDSAHVFKRKIQIPDPLSKFPNFHQKKKVKFPPPSNTKQANSPGMPGGGMSRFRFDSRITTRSTGYSGQNYTCQILVYQPLSCSKNVRWKMDGVSFNQPYI